MTKLILLSFVCATFNAFGMHRNPDDQPDSKIVLFAQKKQHVLQKIDHIEPMLIGERLALFNKIRKKYPLTTYQPTLTKIPENRPIQFPDKSELNLPCVRPHNRIQEEHQSKQQFSPNRHIRSAPIAIPLPKKPYR